jgi:hypothetical protein
VLCAFVQERESIMSLKPYLIVSAAIFGVVALGHVLRLAYAIPVLLGTWNVPLWLSGFGMLVGGALCIWGFILAGKR